MAHTRGLTRRALKLAYSPFSPKTNWNYISKTQRRCELFVHVYDAVRAWGPMSAYAVGKRVGLSPKHMHRYVRVLVAEGVLEPAPPVKTKARFRAKLMDRKAALKEIERFGYRGIHTHKLKRTLPRHMEIARLTIRRLLGEVTPTVDDYLSDEDWRFR